MPDLGIALSTVISSLNVNQQSLSLIASNIANANSDNYTRREVVQSSQLVNGVASGVRVEEVRRAVDEFVVSSARRQISNVGRYEVQSQYYDRLSLMLGQPGSANNINGQLDSFFARLAELSNSPEQGSLRTNTLESANTLATGLSGLARNIETLRFDADAAIADQVTEINNNLDALSSINLSIKNVTIGGGDKTALYDARDKALSDLSKILDVNVSFASDGSVSVFLPQTEILGTTSRFNISYTPAGSVESIIDGNGFNAVQVQLLDSSGNPTGNTVNLVPASSDTTHQPLFTSGTLKGLLDLRDTELPNLLDQLNELATTLADQFNAVHNDGAGFPPPSTLTGTRLITPSTDYNFSGSVRIAVLGSNGSPVNDSFGNGGLPPLTLDFDTLTSTGSPGETDLNTIVREINQYFGPPPSHIASMGPLRDFRMAAVSDSIDSTPATGDILFSANLGVGDQVVIDGVTYTMVANGTASNGANIELGTNIGGTLQNMSNWLNASTNPTVSAAHYSFSGSSLLVTHNTGGDSPNTGFSLAVNLGGGRTGSINGGAATATASGTLANGVDANGNFTFDLEMTNTSGQDATFEITDLAINGGGATGQTLGPFTSTAGTRQRTNLGGAAGGDSLTINLGGLGVEEGGTFTVTATVKVTDGQGNITNDTVTFTVTVPDAAEDIRNTRYSATGTGGGDAEYEAPQSNARFATASIVNAEGSPVQSGQQGYLQIVSNRTGAGIVFDELDSREGGTLDDTAATVTGRGFSHFFGLNDFFTVGTDPESAAVNFAVRDGYNDDPSRLATATLALSNQPSDPDADPVYTYEIGIGSNQLATRLSELKTARQNFDAAGGLPSSTLTFGGYSSEFLSFVAVSNNRVGASLDQEQTLYDAFQAKIDATGGINIDEELANTVLFQNNFNASARLITIISQMLDKMIESF